MAKLIINPDTASAWETELRPGTNLLGSSPASDFQIDHPSIEGIHCQLVVTDSGIQLKDVSSGKQTFINNIAVNQSILRSGDILQLGEVQARCETNGAHPANAEQRFCLNHLKSPARHHCPTCNTDFCDLCVDRLGNRRGVAKLCRKCRTECDRLIREIPSESKPVFAKSVGSAFVYPFKSDGIVLLIAGAVFFCVVSFLARYSAIVGLLLMVFATGYLLAYYQRILLSTSIGEDRMPDWPEFTDWSDLLSPILQFIGTLLFSFGPALLIQLFVPEELAVKPWLYWSGILFGCFYFPMAFLAVTMADSFSALNPLAIVPSVLNCGWTYVQAMVVLAGIFGVNWFANGIISKALPVPIVTDVAAQWLSLYLAVVEMRILGLVYLAKKHELGWFEA
mgnify:CR=1 FL=1|jgi:Uncharacterized conserved protein, contains FHA domain